MNVIEPIAGFEGIFSVSSAGIVYRHRGDEMKPLHGAVSYHGYRKVKLSHGNDRKIEYIHRLVAATFIGKPTANDFVRHNNGDKLDNRVENLAYISRAETASCYSKKGESNRSAKLTDEQVRTIRRVYADSSYPISEIARHNHVSESTVKNIVNGKTWKHIA
jgi:hypothetical protein